MSEPIGSEIKLATGKTCYRRQARENVYPMPSAGKCDTGAKRGKSCIDQVTTGACFVPDWLRKDGVLALKKAMLYSDLSNQNLTVRYTKM